MEVIKLQTYDFGTLLLKVEKWKSDEFMRTVNECVSILTGKQSLLVEECMCCKVGENFWTRMVHALNPVLLSVSPDKSSFIHILSCAKTQLQKLAVSDCDCPFKHLTRECLQYIIPVNGILTDPQICPLLLFEKARLTVANCSLQFQIKAAVLYADIIVHATEVAQFDVVENKIVDISKENCISFLVDILGSLGHRYVHRCFDQPTPNKLKFQPDFSMRKIRSIDHNGQMYAKIFTSLKSSSNNVNDIIAFASDINKVSTVMFIVSKLVHRYAKYPIVQDFTQRWALRFFMQRDDTDPKLSNFLHIVFLLTAGYCPKFADKYTQTISRAHTDTLKEIVRFLQQLYEFLLKYPLNTDTNVIGNDALTLFYSNTKCLPEILNKLVNLF